MKLALIFLTIFVAVSHQQYFHPRMMFGFPWMSPFSQQPLDVDEYVNEEAYPDFMRWSSRNGIVQEEELADVQSRIKGYSGNLNGLSRYQPISPSFNNQQKARFFFNWANTANSANTINNGIFNNNPFFKTATFTVTSTLTLASIISCVPAFQVSAAPVACRRKRNDIQDLVGEQFPIIPSETLKLMPTAISSPQDRGLDVLSSFSEDALTLEESSTRDHHLRDKRFLINMNQFVVSSTLTTYAFVNTTVTVTVNLINPAPTVQCAAAPAAPVSQCVACLPAGLIACPAAG